VRDEAGAECGARDAGGALADRLRVWERDLLRVQPADGAVEGQLVRRHAESHVVRAAPRHGRGEVSNLEGGAADSVQLDVEASDIVKLVVVNINVRVTQPRAETGARRTASVAQRAEDAVGRKFVFVCDRGERKEEDEPAHGIGWEWLTNVREWGSKGL